MNHKINYDAVMKKTHLLPGFTAYRYQQSLPRCIACQDICVQQSHAAKRLIL